MIRRMVSAIPVPDLGIGDRFRVRILNDIERSYDYGTQENVSQERPEGFPSHSGFQQEN